jgi:Reverse transcriptase (RNA-dependent DNA polymerase)
VGQDSTSYRTRPRSYDNLAPGPSNVPDSSDDDSNPSTEEDDTQMKGTHDFSYLARDMTEGGHRAISYLLHRAVNPSEKLLPDASNMNFRDIKLLSPQLQAEWLDTCRGELEDLHKRQVYDLVDLPAGRKAIANKWVFLIKSDGRKRARLVAKGFSQVEGVDYDEIFSPVIRYETVRMMFALSALEGMYMTGLDVKAAFLYGKLDEEIYMKQPEGFEIKNQNNKVMLLKRALYGLKQAALAWWKELEAFMKTQGFYRAHSDAGIFIYKDNRGRLVIALVYVDDGLFFGIDKSFVDKKKKACLKHWECRDTGDVTEFLGIRVTRDAGKIQLDQRKYLAKVLDRFQMTNAKIAQTPLPTGWNPTENKNAVNPVIRQKYQTVIGSLLYLMLGTRPDIAFAVIKMSQFSANPSQEHLDKAMYIMRYLVGTQDYSIVYDGVKAEGLIAYTDSDWAADQIKRRSTTGYFATLAGGIICWQSRLQKTVALSSTEAEYMALSDTSRQIKWIQSIFSELGFALKAIPICADNQGSIFIGSNPVQERRTKHIDIRYHYVRECIEEGDVSVVFIEGKENPADMFTKNLGATLFLKFRDSLGITFKSSEIANTCDDTCGGVLKQFIT